jgi:aspartyl-tRNA(Asn)/glutamyl-tRNA(Gln) amidotransferase subunit C
MANKQITDLAKLANLELNPELESALDKTLPDVLEFVEQIKSLSLETTEGTYRTTEEENVTREDVVKPSLTPKQALSNAARTWHGYFVVPQILIKE